jgi:hypothetical protein
VKPKPKKKRAPPRPHGRPSLYTKKLAAEICQRVARGEYLTHIAHDDHMPAYSTLKLWVEDDRKEAKEDALEEGFSSLYARAQDEDCDRRLIEIERVASMPNEWSITIVRQIGDKMIREVKKVDNVERSRLDLAAKQWIAIRQHKRRLALGRDAMREMDGDDAAQADGELHVIIEGGLPADGAAPTDDLPPDPFTDPVPE